MLGFLPLYSKLSKHKVLGQDRRIGILDAVAEQPGIGYTKLMTNLGLTKGVLTYHLSVLEREGYLTSQSRAGRRRIFPTDVGGNVVDPFEVSIDLDNPVIEKRDTHLKRHCHARRIGIAKQPLSQEILELEGGDPAEFGVISNELREFGGSIGGQAIGGFCGGGASTQFFDEIRRKKPVGDLVGFAESPTACENVAEFPPACLGWDGTEATRLDANEDRGQLAE